MSNQEEGLAWQVGVWDRISQIYWSEIDRRLAPVVDTVLARADLQAGERVLDLGTGTGAVAEKAALAVEPGGHVLAIDISPEMLAQPVHLRPLALGIRLQRQKRARHEPFRDAREDLSGDRIAEGRRRACAEEENPPCLLRLRAHCAMSRDRKTTGRGPNLARPPPTDR